MGNQIKLVFKFNINHLCLFKHLGIFYFSPDLVAFVEEKVLGTSLPSFRSYNPPWLMLRETLGP